MVLVLVLFLVLVLVLVPVPVPALVPVLVPGLALDLGLVLALAPHLVGMVEMVTVQTATSTWARTIGSSHVRSAGSQRSW